MVNIFHVAGFIDFIVDPSMQVMSDTLERFVQSSAQQASAAAAPEQPATSERNGSSQSGNEVAANGGANSGAPTSILPGMIACVYDTRTVWS